MEETEDGIAVIGIGCNFPGGEGPENFWKVLIEGRNCAAPIPRERFDINTWYDPDDNKAGKSRTTKAALVDGFNQFDHRFFGITDSEVEQMDPQHKQLLQCVYRALENAGIPMEKASGTRTGVFFGLMNRDYETYTAYVHPTVINHWSGTGVAMSIASNRVSFIFNFTGPSLTLDCACSSSLVALHLACQSIKQGDCDMAVCGAVNCIIEPRVFVALSKAKMISPDGTTKPFSNRADGYGRGEGCGVVLLKPLKKAIEDRDHIWGIISKTAVNQDGHSVTPITKPSMTQQEELLRRIYSETDLANVQYIEAHGTGTPVGDQTEAGSISNVIAKAKPLDSETLRIGSVKSNIGHTESAAGVAGLIKVLLMMKHETIVPTVFYSEENESVDTKALNIKVPVKAEKWEASGMRIAGVNSFGFGGTNAHAIVKQHKQTLIKQKNDERRKKCFVMSANSVKSLTLMMEDTIKHLEADSEVDLDSLLYTLACKRSHQKHKYRKALVVSSLDELREKLNKLNAGKSITRCDLDQRLVFVFCGNGISYHGMCKEILKREPVFRDKLKEISKLFLRLSTLNILDTLESEVEDSDFRTPCVVQPLLFAIQVAITTQFRHWGVKPDAVLGHSVGEVAAAHCSGLLSLEDAIKVIYHRSTLQNTVTGGKMLVIGNMAVSEVTALLPRFSDRICLAAFNSPKSCTVSGDADAIESLYKELNTSLNSKNLFLRVMDVSVAYHSHMMDPILPDIMESVGSLQGKDLETELFSTVTGKEVQQGDFCTGEYWSRNIREPVAFEQAVKSATKGKKNVVFVEIGPRRALQRNIMESLGNDTPVLASVQPQKDHETVMSVVPTLFEQGVHVDWNIFYRGHETLPLSIPKYQFDCSDRDVVIGAAQNSQKSNHPILSQSRSETTIFTCDPKSDSAFYLKEHKHNEVPIIPGAFYAELGLAAFMATAKPKVPLSSLQLSVNFHSVFVLTPNSPKMRVQLEQTEKETRFRVFSPFAMYASGAVVSKNERLMEECFISPSSIFNRCKSVVSSQEFYWYLSQGGFQFGDVFKNKADVYFGEDLKEAYSVVTVPEQLQSQLHDYYIHPVMLDFLMQILPMTVEHRFAVRAEFPTKIGSLTVFEPLKDEMIVYLRAIDVNLDHYELCGCFADKEGRVLVEVKHVIVKFLGSHSNIVEEYFYHNAFSVLPESTTPSSPPPTALVFCDNIGISKGLQQYLDSKSRYVSFEHAKDILSHGFQSLLSNLSITDVEKNFDEVLLLWGKENLTSLQPDVVLENLVSSCEIFRQIVLELKRISYPNSIRTVTYCSSDIRVDHISPDFALSGMTRSIALEIPDLSFQLIDISSISAMDIAALSEILRACPCSTYPELVIKDGLILKPSFVRTRPAITDKSQGHFTSTKGLSCFLQTADAHKMLQLSAVHFEEEAQQISDTSVEIRLTKICAHSSDYFPISESHHRFGKTIYWNKHSSQNHKLLALDFSGIVTVVGKDVHKLKVGDHVASCYPVVAASKVRVPEEVCYSTKRFPFLQKTPCVSYIVLAWEILNQVLPRAKQNLGIISSVPDSALMKILALASCNSGWNVVVGTQCNGSFKGVNQIDAFVVLPPFDDSWIAKICNFPSVQHVVLICDTKCSLSPDMYQNGNENVCVQMIQMQFILQKAYLRAERPHIYHWLKSLGLSRQLFLESFTFQSVKSGNIKSLNSEIHESYFNSKELAVVALDEDPSGNLSEIPLLPTKKQLFNKTAVYIVTGGLSGLGLETVRFISHKGGGYIVILSRSKPTPEVQQEIHNVEKKCGNYITNIECDVSVSESVQRVIGVIGQKFPSCPIRGVFHSAVVLHDGLIETLDRSLYEKVLKPKVNGALNLHNATQNCQLDYFVCYSSISAFLGNASQTNYTAANTFLDTFCQYRRKLGLPAQSINWGALNLGLLLKKEHLQRFLEAKGIRVLELADIHNSLEQCLVLNRPQQAVCRFHFRNIRYNILSQNPSLTTRMSALVEEAFQKFKEADTLTSQTESFSPRDYAINVLSETIGMDKSKLRDDSPLITFGFDSMQAMTLQYVIFQELGVNVPLVKLLDANATLSTFVSILSQRDRGENIIDKLVPPPVGKMSDVSTSTTT